MYDYFSNVRELQYFNINTSDGVFKGIKIPVADFKNSILFLPDGKLKTVYIDDDALVEVSIKV